MPIKFAKPSDTTIPVDVVSSEQLRSYLDSADARTKNWLSANGFTAKLGQTVLIADNAGKLERAVTGWGDANSRSRDRFHIAPVAKKLPKGAYHLGFGLEELDPTNTALAWLLAGYSFDRYKSRPKTEARLKVPDGVDALRVEAIARGDFLTRDLINTPASDMGPEALEKAFQDIAKPHGAVVSCIRGADLLEQNFPMIHAVGRASDQEPRLLELLWGNEADPAVTLVGKGVCFDTGGLNIKPGASMGLMKKDMGGAATVLGLAEMIMSRKLKVRLRVLVPAVENSISAGAFRPQDVLTSRKGLTVEINNTDAEGRLVLADTLALADEQTPEMLICMATLTGAARVALGPDVPPFYTDNEILAADIASCAERADDPLWRLPFWKPYESMIEPDIADLDNAPKGGFAGSITAALFLRRFVENTANFVHLDIYGWAPKAKPARTLGGACQAARALFDVVESRFGV
ncbi:MAG: leucyl aminopeptidase family protein [Rhodobacteraceae bacterium]|nr:leucyl aminopeptidase family protein [Paracoccaceae bacterium]